MAAGESTQQDASKPYSSTQLTNVLPLQLVPTVLCDYQWAWSLVGRELINLSDT